MATITLDKQLDSEQFLLIPRVPIFREHYLRLPDGRTVYFDRVKLQQIAEVQRGYQESPLTDLPFLGQTTAF
ncbi:MAG: hypothetical protein WHT09_11115 [Thermogutta sp.]|jgi:hypothetical protein